ncbi:MAG: hypothetical protein ACFFB9_15520, partial [Promethearchaeota archaeon]
MINQKTQKYAILFTIFFAGSILGLSINSNLQVLNSNIEFENEYETDTLKIATSFGDIVIDVLLTTNTSTSGNWTWAKNVGICTGFGTPGSPYRIQGHIFEYSSGTGDCLRILNSRDYFVIIDSTFRNSAGSGTGLFLSNTTNGRILNSFAYNNYIG